MEANSRDAAAANEALASLRTSVANAFDRFGKGELPAEGLLEELHSLGVEVCRGLHSQALALVSPCAQRQQKAFQIAMSRTGQLVYRSS